MEIREKMKLKNLVKKFLHITLLPCYFATWLFYYFTFSFLIPAPSVWAWGDGFTITLNVVGGDTIAPQAVTDLTASTTATPGEVELIWTAPHEDGTKGGAVTKFEIRCATFSIDSISSDTTAWWDGNADYSKVVLPDNEQPGQEESEIINLDPGTTYYFAIKSYDNVPLTSLIDVNAATPGSQSSCFIPGINLGDVVINEIMYDSPFAEFAGEWIELYNTTDNDIDLSGWVINDLNTNIVIPDGTIIKTKSDVYGTKGCLVLTENEAAFINYEYELAGVSYVEVEQLRFDEDSDTITLSKNGIVISQVSYDKSWGGATPGSGNTLEKIDPYGADDDANWGKCMWSTSGGGTWGTPGVPNSIYQDKIPPAAISNLTALTGSSEGTVKLKWTAPGDDGLGASNVSSYLVKYATRYIGTNDFNAAWVSTYSQDWTPANFGTEEGTAGNRVVNDLTSGVTYWFAIKAKDAANKWGTWTSSGTDSTVNINNWEIAYDTNPAAPSGLTALSIDTSTIKVSWNVNSEPDFNEYELDYSSFSLTEGWQNLLSTTSITFSHMNLQKNNTYYYRIKAHDNGELYSGWSSVYTFPKDPPPSAPSNFSGVAQSTYSIQWSWEDVANETGYRIRSDTDGIMQELSADTTCWPEINLSANTSYYRYAEAYNSSGSSASASDVKFTLANPPSGSYFTGVSSESLTISWSENGNPSHTRWEILRSTDNFISTNTLTNFTSNYTNTSYTDSGLISAVTYWYKVRAFNGDERESEYDITISTLTKQLTQTYKISGYVKDFRSTGLASVTVALSGYSSISTVTGEDGYFEFASLPAEQDYAVSPATAVINGKLYSFLPVSRSTICLSADITDWEFRGEPAHVEGKPLAPVFICPPHNFLSFGSEVEKITIYSPGGRKILDISGCVWYGTRNNSMPASASGMIESGPYIYKDQFG